MKKLLLIAVVCLCMVGVAGAEVCKHEIFEETAGYYRCKQCNAWFGEQYVQDKKDMREIKDTLGKIYSMVAVLHIKHITENQLDFMKQYMPED